MISRAKIERKAIETYGEPRQTVKCMEECAELIEALSDTLNTPGVIKICARIIKRLCKLRFAGWQPVVMIASKKQREHIREELADTRIMGDQMRMIFGPTDVEEHAKLMRSARRLGMPHD